MPSSEPAIQTVKNALDAERLTVNALDDGSGVLLDIEGEQLLTLNATGMRLVQAIEAGADDVEALRDMLCEEFEVEPERAEADARTFVREVAEAL
ncbi:MAG: PqqD family protein [Candidatus Wenzhouxiangella sp. M2_3B_020]